MKNKVYGVVLFLLSIILVLLIYTEHKEKQEQAVFRLELQKEAKPYEEEIQSIRTELINRTREIYAASSVSCVMPCFVLTSTDDIKMVENLSADYAFTPSIVLDCTEKEADLVRIAEAAVQKRYGILMTGTPFNEEVLKKASRIKTMLSELDATFVPAFLLRHTNDTRENREKLLGEGYSNLFLYSDTLSSGRKGGIDYLPYGFIRSYGSAESVADSIESVHTSMLVVFDLADLHNSTVTEKCISDCLNMFDKRVAVGRLNYTETREAFLALTEETIQQKEEEYQTYVEEQKGHIKELQKKVNEIYSRKKKT